jgi:ankyrin repeat protein
MNNTPIVQWLVDNTPCSDIELNFQGHNALYYACENNNEFIVEALLRKGANVSIYNLFIYYLYNLISN